MTEPPDHHDDESRAPSVDTTLWTGPVGPSTSQSDINTSVRSEFTTNDAFASGRPEADPTPPDPSTPEARFSQLAARVAAAKASARPRPADLLPPEPHQQDPSFLTMPPSAEDAITLDLRSEESPGTGDAPDSSAPPHPGVVDSLARPASPADHLDPPEPVASRPEMVDADATASDVSAPVPVTPVGSEDTLGTSDSEATGAGGPGDDVFTVVAADPAVLGAEAEVEAAGPTAGDVEDRTHADDGNPSSVGSDLSVIDAEDGADEAVGSGSDVSPDSSTPAGSRPDGVPTARVPGAAGGGAAGVQPELDELADPDRLRAAVEAVLLVIDTPTSAVMFAQVLGRSVPEIEAALRTLQGDYDDGGRGIDLREVADGWRLYSRDEFAGYVERFVLDGQQARLTQAALETLSVIAYRQPVTRSRISGIRGVSVDAVMRTLLTRGLVEECGADPDTGGGLYRTTRLFLEKLGLRSLDELPSLAPLLPDTSQLDDVELST